MLKALQSPFAIGDPTSPAVAAQQQVLANQLNELKTLRQDMQAMYDSSQQEVVDVRAEATEAKAVAAREREKAATVVAENAGLRRWNETLAAELASMRSELLRGAAASAQELGLQDEADEAEAAHLMAKGEAAQSAATGVSVDLGTLQQVQLEASATALRLTHAHAKLKRKNKELRAMEHRMGQLQSTAQALSSDLASATAQIGKLESRIRSSAEAGRQLEQLSAEHAALNAELERTSGALARAREEQTALTHGPLAASERRAAALDERERRMRVVLERKVRQAAEMAAAVQTLGSDSRMRIEENVKLRLLAQKLGASKKELDATRRAPADGAAEHDFGGSGLGHRDHVAERIALATAWVPVTDEPAHHPGAFTTAGWAEEEATMAHAAAASSPPATRYLRPSTGHMAVSSVASTRAPHTAASAASTAQPYATPAEALQSQTALQEKLKRVRNTFADIRRQVGYTDD